MKCLKRVQKIISVEISHLSKTIQFLSLGLLLTASWTAMGEKSIAIQNSAKPADSFEFNGKNTYIKLKNGAAIFGHCVTEGKIELWVKPARNNEELPTNGICGPFYEVLFAFEKQCGNINPDGYNQIALYRRKNKQGSCLLEARVASYNNLTRISIPSPLKKNIWTAIGLVWNTKEISLFINNKLVKKVKPQAGNLIFLDKTPGYLGAYKGKYHHFYGTMKPFKIQLPKQVPTLLASKINNQPASNGKNTNIAWGKCGTVSKFVLNKHENISAKKQSCVQLSYDNNFIYVKFTLEEPDIKNIKAVHNADNTPVWEDDCVEIFFDVNNNKESYYHFIINSLGAKTAEYKATPNSPSTICNNKSWNAAVFKGDNHWQAEVAIPFSFFNMKKAPEDGASWGISLNRGAKTNKEYSGWPNGYFHRPDKFGRMIFNSYKTNLCLKTKMLREKIDKLQHVSSSENNAAIKLLKKINYALSQIQEDINAEVNTDELNISENSLNCISQNIAGIEFKLMAKDIISKLKNNKHNQAESTQLEKEILNLENKYAKLDSPNKTNEEMSEIAQLRASYWQMFSGKSYFCWQKSPWDNLLPEQMPSLNTTECRHLTTGMGINEHQPVVVAITNFTPQDAYFKVKRINGTALKIDIREGYSVKTLNGKMINDALPVLETLRVPPLQSREIWFAVSSKNVKAGEYQEQFLIAAENMRPFELKFDIKVNPLTLPERPDEIPIYICVWDYITTSSDSIFKNKAKKDLLEHYLTVPYIQFSLLPWPSFSKDGKMNIDYNRFDKALEFWKNDQKAIGFCLNFGYTYYGAQKYFGDEKEYLTASWKERFISWLKAFTGHLRERGLTVNDYFLHVFDETTSPVILPVYKLIKEVNPAVKILFTVTGVKNLKEIQDLIPFIDIWCPCFTYLNDKKILTMIRKKNDVLWAYHNPPVNVYKEANPYTYYRLAFWRAWKNRMQGCGMWTYCRRPEISWNEYKLQRSSHDMIYLSKYAPPDVSKKEIIIPSKRWEAWRQGAEDYLYLDLLAKQIKQLEGKKEAKTIIEKARQTLDKWPGIVLNEEADHSLADKARKEIIKITIELKKIYEHQNQPN